MAFVDWLASKWAVNDPLPQNCDLLVAVAHGATETGLTNGAYAVSRRTAEIIAELDIKESQRPYLAFGAFTESSNPEIERIEKQRIFGEYRKYIGLVISTIEECLKVKEAIPVFFTPRNILIVTDEAHSRRCRIVWKCFFPNSNIRIISVPIAETVDPRSPMKPYRQGKWAILGYQALPTPYFWYLALRGPKYMATKATKFHQPVAK